ncbi:Ldh family oxidoreductase [Martelella alba]|uniref:Delta(1)-pyrroline-2-carboxylate/Delta(1)-piperideine-2-carboxylate reductase n=1 Tax=Martelella alba TaxID=2590451 RepID=A0A506UEJ0_9HYPH|nr:Ldh family oxidoreductase [Martelella alba]TPW31571.1 Ldh family oxidoreductase [Martelella alba]
MAGSKIEDPTRQPVSFDALKDLLEAVFSKAGAAPNVARILAANCAGCERDGALSHGIFRIPGYLKSIESGWVDPAATPVVELAGDSFIRVDAANGFAQPAVAAAMPLVIEKARQNGVALLAVRNSHHFSALWPDVEPFAQDGLLALSMVNSFPCAVAFGAHEPVFGTNPISFAAPCAGSEPIVADLATSAIANGDVQIAAREGKALPPDHGVDRNGQPTTDPKAVLDGGALLTFGGYKGAAISMMIELFCAALTGGKFSFEVDWSAYPGAETPHTGQLIIVIDPDSGRSSSSFAARARQFVERLEAAGASRLPGERRYRNREQSIEKGILIRNTDLQRLRQLADGEAVGAILP